MQEFLINKFFAWSSWAFISFGFIANISDFKGWIIFILTAILLLLRFILTSIQIKKTVLGEDAIKKTFEYKILKFFKILK